jgi:hypothetical protein
MRELELAAAALDRSGFVASAKRAGNEGLAARAALAAEPAGEPSDEDLRALASKLVKIHADDYGYVYEVLPFARAVLARWGRPAALAAPETGEVGELVALIRQIALAWEPDACLLGNMTAGQLARAATLLQQQAAPAPVAVPVGECPHCGYEGVMARVPQAGEGER